MLLTLTLTDSCGCCNRVLAANVNAFTFKLATVLARLDACYFAVEELATKNPRTFKQAYTFMTANPDYLIWFGLNLGTEREKSAIRGKDTFSGRLKIMQRRGEAWARKQMP